MTENSSKIPTHILGCKVNHADVQAVVERLRGRSGPGFELIGTCCVTAEGERQSRKEVRRALKRVGDGGKVFVTGCAAQLNTASFAGLGGNVQVLLGDAATVAARIDEETAGEGELWPDGAEESAEPGRTRFFLKVQDGCANMCSYCVLPAVRGRPRSLEFEPILAEAQAKLAAGYPELVVNGINVGAYDDNGRRLGELLERLAQLPGLKRLRLSSVEVASVTAELLEVFQRHEIIGRHLHLPLQSGADSVLAAMRRRYDTTVFAERVELIRSRLPEVNLTTDVIVGFPSEDEDAFAQTLAFVERIGFSKVHVFSYSPRPGAAAARLNDAVPSAEKKRRSAELRRLSDRLGVEYRQRKLGRVSEVLIESQLASGLLGGYSSDYTRYEVEGGQAGAFLPVRGEAVIGEAIKGKVVAHER